MATEPVVTGWWCREAAACPAGWHSSLLLPALPVCCHKLLQSAQHQDVGNTTEMQVLQVCPCANTCNALFSGRIYLKSHSAAGKGSMRLGLMLRQSAALISPRDEGELLFLDEPVWQPPLDPGNGQVVHQILYTIILHILYIHIFIYCIYHHTISVHHPGRVTSQYDLCTAWLILKRKTSLVS